MATLVVGDVDVDTYGSIYDEERVVPLATMDRHHGTNTNRPSSPPSWKTKKLLMGAGIIGMTAAVASSALLFFSIMDFPKQENRSGNSIIAGTPAAIALVRSTTTTTHDGYDRYPTFSDDDASVDGYDHNPTFSDDDASVDGYDHNSKM